MVHLFYHCGITREPAWIQVLHLPRERPYLFCRLRIVTDHLPKLLKLPHLLADAALRIGGIARGIWRRNLLRTSRMGCIVAGIEIAPHSAIPATAASSRVAAGTIARISARTANAITSGLLLACARLSITA
jgi:hypothetical protein